MSASPPSLEIAAQPPPTPCEHGISERRPSVDLVAPPPRGSPPSVLRSFRPLPARQVKSPGLRPPRAIRGSPVPSSWFLTTSTTCSGTTARALLQPAADPGVHRVSRCGRLHPRSPKRRWPARPRRFPRCTHPAKILPIRSASLAHARALPPCRCSWWRPSCALVPKVSRFTATSCPPGLDFEGLFCEQVCCHRPPLPTTDDAVLPWASVLP
jgi:hypothetical protein